MPTGTTHGIDVSAYQGTIDWAAVKQSGSVDFVYAKATEGISEIDPQYDRNKNVCKIDRGIPFGSYHFFHPDSDPEQQAKHFLSVIESTNLDDDLLPMVDVETSNGVSPSELVSNLHKFLAKVLCSYRQVVIYTDLGFWNQVGINSFSMHPLWIAEYNNDPEPTLPAAWSEWVLWQYSCKGSINGIMGDVDLDVLNPRVAFKTLQV